MSGTLYGLGIGPGDPELITVKALRLLERVPVIAYPAPEQGESLARKIVAPHLSGGGKKTEVAIRMPLVAARFPAEAVYDRAAEALGGPLEAGLAVAVLFEGDPFFYAAFMYLFGRMVARFTAARRGAAIGWKRCAGGWLTWSMSPGLAARKGLAGVSRNSATFSARSASGSAAAASSRLWRMLTAPSGPITAISALGQAKLTSVRMCLLDITQ